MTTKSIITTLIIILIIAIGVAGIQALIVGGCYLLLAMFKYPGWSIVTLAGLLLTVQIVHTVYYKAIKK